MSKVSEDEARRRLSERIRGMQPELPAMQSARRFAAKDTDFLSLPGYAEFQLQRDIGARLGLDNPYFRMHEGRSGARAEIAGRTFLNFSSYDYLGLNGHPEIIEAAKDAVDRYGISASGSRPISGERAVHRELEQALANHYGVAASVTFVSGYATNLGVIGQLLGPKDILFYDAAVHNSAVLGGILSNATRRSFRHNDLDNLEEMLVAQRASYERAMIVVEGLYGMDGDYPDLPRLIEIKNRHRAWLMVDEAHAFGVLGRHGKGIADLFDVPADQVDIWMGTLSKTLCACGGYIAGSAELIDYLKCAAGVFVYSVAMPPVIAAGAHKALEIMHREPERIARLQTTSALFLRLAHQRGLDTGTAAGYAVAPVMMHESLPAALISQKLFERGINVQPIMYPGVPAKASRLRFFLTAEHSEQDVHTAVDAVAEEWKAVGDAVDALIRPTAS